MDQIGAKMTAPHPASHLHRMLKNLHRTYTAGGVSCPPIPPCGAYRGAPHRGGSRAPCTLVRAPARVLLGLSRGNRRNRIRALMAQIEDSPAVEIWVC